MPRFSKVFFSLVRKLSHSMLKMYGLQFCNCRKTKNLWLMSELMETGCWRFALLKNNFNTFLLQNRKIIRFPRCRRYAEVLKKRSNVLDFCCRAYHVYGKIGEVLPGILWRQVCPSFRWFADSWGLLQRLGTSMGSIVYFLLQNHW